MNYEDYRRLVKRFGETDSRKDRKKMMGEILDVAKSLLTVLNAVHSRYGAKFVDKPHYSTERGEYALHAILGDTLVTLQYTVPWAKGGSCKFNIDVPMHYLDEDRMDELECQLRDMRIGELKKKIDDAQAGCCCSRIAS